MVIPIYLKFQPMAFVTRNSDYFKVKPWGVTKHDPNTLNESTCQRQEKNTHLKNERSPASPES